MKKEEAIKEKSILLDKLKAIQEIIDKPEITPKQRLLEILNGCETKIDKEKYPDSIFFFKNGEYYFEIEKQYLWCRYKYVWRIFESEFSMNYNQIQWLIKETVEEHFKCKGLTPSDLFEGGRTLVEEHFKCKGLTPITPAAPIHSGVEEHFKCKGLTPRFEAFVQSKKVEEHFKCKGLTPKQKKGANNK